MPTFIMFFFPFLLDYISSLCLKDLSHAVTTELIRRIEKDPTVLQDFYQSFGLDREKMHYRGLEKIRELFPDTPVTLLRDVFDKLQLYDLVDLLEKVKPRTLRPALPMKEMDKLVNARKQRPPKFYRKAEVLIIEYSGRAPLDAPSVERIGSFFQSINSQNQVKKVTAKVPEQSLPDLIDLRSKKKRAEDLNLEKIEQEIKQKEEELQRELQGEKDKFQMAVSLVMDRWICQANDEG